MSTSRAGKFAHQPMFTGVEGSLFKLVLPTIQMIVQSNDSIDEQLTDRGLIPLRLMESLIVLKFVSATVLSAQRAQRKFGVPASVLMAMAMFEHCSDASNLTEGKSFATGCCCCVPSGIESWFIERAKLLSRSPKFREAMASAADVNSYLERLLSLGFFEDRLDMADVLAIVDHNDLRECDLAGELMPGEFARSRYATTRDHAGRVTFIPAVTAADLRGERRPAF